VTAMSREMRIEELGVTLDTLDKQMRECNEVFWRTDKELRTFWAASADTPAILLVKWEAALIEGRILSLQRERVMRQLARLHGVGGASR